MDTLEAVFDERVGSYVISNEAADAPAADGAAKREVEWEIYGRVKDLGDLAKAQRLETQEQWGLPIFETGKNYCGGTMRVRSINDGEQYIFTTKIKDASGNEEVEEPTSQARFIHFKKWADTGLRKVRHYFPVEGSDFIYEVDAFHNSLGQFVPWVKIDLEVPEGEQLSIDTMPDLPFELEEARIIPPGKKSAEDLAFVRQLFDEYFNLPNQFRDHHAPAALQAAPAQENFIEERQEEDPDATTLLKTELMTLGENAKSIACALTYNESKYEGELKFKLLEVHHAISYLFQPGLSGSECVTAGEQQELRKRLGVE
jgi:hypothetical protein